MPALASSPARARTVTFMPPESPTPGGASGEECTDRTPTRRTGCSKLSTRAPWIASRSATVTRSTRGCLPAGAHMLPTFGGPPVDQLSPTLLAAALTALVSAAAALRALVPADFTDVRVVAVLRRTRVLAALVRETAARVASAAWRVGRERRTPVTRVSPRRASSP